MKQISQGLRIALLLSCFLSSAWAETLAPSAGEASYAYEAKFRSFLPVTDKQKITALALAKFHAGHLFGIFYSPEVLEKTGYSYELAEGFAGTKLPEVSDARSFVEEKDPYLWVQYKAKGTMVVHKRVLEKWKNKKTVSFPLLRDLSAVYADDGLSYRDEVWRKCTDTYYNEARDFSYFYNPYLCKALGSAPIGVRTAFQLTSATLRKENKNHFFPREQLYGDNGNGKLTTLYLMSGLDQIPGRGATPEEIRKDVAWKLFKFGKETLVKKYGFEPVADPAQLDKELGLERNKITLHAPVQLVSDQQWRYINTYVKKTADRIFLARVGSFDTSNTVEIRPLTTFLNFYKEAWENGDFIYFGGHSGDGQDLDLKDLNKNLKAAGLRKIKFPLDKTQVAMLDTCSSYTWYQDSYTAAKRYQNLHLMTVGLVSMAHFSEATVEGLLDAVLEDNEQPSAWVSVIEEIEKRMLPAHVKHHYARKDREEILQYFIDRNEVPTSLMNIWVP